MRVAIRGVNYSLFTDDLVVEVNVKAFKLLMSFYILTYQKLDSLISQKCTGTPRELAYELQLNRNQLYGLLNDIRALGACIYYDRKINSFCYENSVSLKTKVLLETSYINNDDAETMIKVPNMFSSGSFSDS